MASFRLSENLLKSLSEGAGYDAGGAATRGLANYQEQKKQRITDNQNQQTLDLQKLQASNVMERFKIEQKQKKQEFDATLDYRASVLGEEERANRAEELFNKNKYVPPTTYVDNGITYNAKTNLPLNPDSLIASEYERHVSVVAEGMESARAIPKTHLILNLLKEVPTGSVDGAVLKIKKMFGVENADEGQLVNLLMTNVLPQLKKIFGAQFTENEGKLLLGIEPGLGNSSEANVAILEGRLKMMEDSVGYARQSSGMIKDRSANAQMAQLMGEYDPILIQALKDEQAKPPVVDETPPVVVDNNSDLNDTEADLIEVMTTLQQKNVPPRELSSFKQMQARRTPDVYIEGGGI